MLNTETDRLSLLVFDSFIVIVTVTSAGNGNTTATRTLTVMLMLTVKPERAGNVTVSDRIILTLPTAGSDST